MEGIKMKSQKDKEHFIIRSFMVGTHHLWGHKFKEVEKDGTCGQSYTGKVRVNPITYHKGTKGH